MSAMPSRVSADGMQPTRTGRKRAVKSATTSTTPRTRKRAANSEQIAPATNITTAETLPATNIEVPVRSTTRAQASAYANLMGYLPSSYQTDYFDWIERGHGNAVLNAVAGSGKTTVQVSAAKLLPRNVSALFLAFNKHIAEALTLKLVGTPMTARTVHSAGLALVTERLNSGASGGGRIQTDTRKYRQIAKSLLWEYGRNMADDKRVELQKALEELTHLARVTLTEPRDQAALDALMAQYSIALDARLIERLYQLLPVALDEGERLATDARLIDFDDMLWLPARWDLRPRQSVDWLLVDELQDLSRAQLEVALRLLPPDDRGRFCGVGDPQQCQPAGTMVRMTDGSEQPIESLRAGDNVVTYARREGSYIQAGLVNDHATRLYDGMLYTISTNGKATRCTDSHRWMVRWTNRTDNVWVTYLMRKGVSFRVGQTKMYLDSRVDQRGSYDFGLAARAARERADAAWILKVHGSAADALVYEQLLSARYGLPQIIWRQANNAHHFTQDVIDSIYEALGDLTENARRCLTDHGRNLCYPLWSNGESEQQRQGRNTIFETQACNLISGYMAVPVAPDRITSLTREGRAPNWQPITVTAERWSGQVYSLDIARHHKYVADGILTCNSIMAFAGADNASFHHAQARTEAQALPLSICYRCPTSHLALAREIVPQIEARPNAPEGTIGDLVIDKLPDAIRPGDMVICRLTAPLVAACIRLIQRRIPARVRGRDIGNQLTDIIHAVERMPSYTWVTFGKWLDTYEQSQLERLSQREGAESAMESLSDRCQAVRVCYEQFRASDLDALCREIEALFDDGKPAVILSTVHRAKGLEAERVFILRPDKLPLVWPKQQPWEAEQEQHIRYVALTRATAALFWVWG